MNDLMKSTITTMEVADMMEISHNDILRKLERLEENELILVRGGEDPDDKAPNNGDGSCSGTNNGSGKCGGVNNSSGRCG